MTCIFLLDFVCSRKALTYDKGIKLYGFMGADSYFWHFSDYLYLAKAL